jgi:hypothetical protein
MPTIRICSENESFFENSNFWCYLTGILLLLFGWVSSALLQVFGNIDKMPTVESQIHFSFKKVCKPFVTRIQKILNPVTSGLNLFRICDNKKKSKTSK